jgi:hypothetical protein
LSETLTSERIRVPADPHDLYELSLEEGWGDGLPLLPPTEERVGQLLEASPYSADHVVVEKMQPTGGAATVEKIVINAAMAGCAPEHVPYVIAAVEEISRPEFALHYVATSTASATPIFIVNGPSRDRCGFDYAYGCLGGATGRGSRTVGRAVALCLRNIGGQRAGLTSMSCFGQPARHGLCFAEWEEQSPWPSVAEQRGFAKDEDVIHAHGGTGTVPLVSISIHDVKELVAYLARSLAYPATHQMFPQLGGVGKAVLLLNPDWAERIGRVFPDVDDLKLYLWENAYKPIDFWPESMRELCEERADSEGRLHVPRRPDQFLVMVCGGAVDFNAVYMPSYGHSEVQSAAVATVASDF